VARDILKHRNILEKDVRVILLEPASSHGRAVNNDIE